MKRLGMLVGKFEFNSHGRLMWALPELNYTPKRYRGYYMTAHGYEFYLRVFNSISHSFAALTREMSS